MKVLVALSRFPWPTDKGDKLRAWNQLQGLAQEHEVHVFCLSDEPVPEEGVERAQSFCKSVTVFRLSKVRLYFRLLSNIFGNEPFQVAYFNDRRAHHAFRKLWLQLKPDVVYCQLARMAEYCRQYTESYKIIDYQDAFSKGIQRRLLHEGIQRRLLLNEEYRRLKAYEADIFEDFNCRTIISRQDAELIHHHENEKLIVLPNGVDTDYYHPEPVSKTLDLLFTGNMQYEPNVNCVLYMVNEVLPLLADELPHIQLVVAGKNPARELRRIRSRNLQLTGWVDDLRKYYRQARLFVAPMQIGIGMQNKILEAMSMGMPVITSSLANNAIGGEHGKNVWVADSPRKVAEGIAYLIANTELAISIGRNARQLMIEQYSWQKQNERFNRLLSRQVQLHVPYPA